MGDPGRMHSAKEKTMDAYGDFAYIYDELMDTTPYQEWCALLMELIRKYGVSEPERDTGDMLKTEKDLIVDLGCGTGTLAELLYQKGFDVIGIDASSAMLEVAAGKREISGSRILYLNQDMRELELYGTAGTFISVCDSLNYILEEAELKQVFAGVNNYLYPGGLFIFDFNTDYKYREVIGDRTIAENRENCSFIWENDYEEETALNEYDLTFFSRKEGEECFYRFQETHVQRGYRPEEITGLLEEAGLRVLEMRDSDTGGEVTGTSERILVVAGECQKKG